jgi:Tfp pilus assembly protein PilX
MEIMKIIIGRIIKLFKLQESGEKGQAFLLVLILLLVGTLIISSTLAFIGASIKTNGPYLSNTNDLYAAESGVQDGENNVLNQTDQGLNTLFQTTPATTFSQYDYTDSWSYNMPNSVNGDYPVAVTVKNTWVPLIDDKNPTWIPTVSQPSPPDQNPQPSQIMASNIINNTNLVVSGVANVASKSYTVTINYLDSTPSTPLPIISIGVWFPQGYTFNADITPKFYSTEQVVRSVGNEAVIWSFPSNTTFSSLQTSMGQHGNSISITFSYAASASLTTNIPAALSWVNCGNDMGNTVFPYDYTWDANVRVYDITSLAGHTQIEATVPTSGVRAIGSAISGDYVATGGSLRDNVDSAGYRWTLVPSSSSTVSSIPTGSSVEAAYLYWSGWVQGNSNPNVSTTADYDNTVTFSIGSSGTINETVPSSDVYNSAVFQPDILWYAPVRSGRSGTITINGSTVTATGPQPANFNNQSSNEFGTYADVIAGSNYISLDGTNNWYLAQNVNSNTQLTLSANSGINTTGNPDTYSVFDGYYYACKIDVTDTVKDYSNGANLTGQSPIYGNGDGNYTVGGVYSDNASVMHPGQSIGDSSFGGWSLVIIYANSSTTGHQLYLYDEMESISSTSGNNYIPITGFIVPPQGSEPNNTDAVKLTTFIGEGDKQIIGDYVAFINQVGTQYFLWDGVTDDTNDTQASPKDAFNSESLGLNAPGIDLDTYHILWAGNYWANTYISAGDSKATIDLYTQGDGIVSVYVIASFRSTVTSGGAISYLITHQ